MASASDMLVRRCTSFVFNLLKTDLDEWMRKNCHHFNEDLEMKLVYTDLYTKFNLIVEEKMKDFVKDEGYSSMRGLAKDMRDAVINSDRSSLYLNTLLAALDFEKFVKLMQHHSRRKREEQKMENQGESDTSGNDDDQYFEGKHK